MVRTVLNRSALGAVIGIVISQAISIIISLCIGDGNFHAAVPQLAVKINSEIGAVIVQTACSLLYGAVFGGISIIWDLDNWNLFKQTVVHFFIVSVITMPIAYIAQWMPHSILGVVVYYAIFVFIYASIWLSQYIVMKKQLRAINEKLKEIA